jgi:cell division protein FtsW (lipid II flippase)
MQPVSTQSQQNQPGQARGPFVACLLVVAVVSICVTLLEQVGVIALMVMFFGGAVLLLPARTRWLGAALVLGVLAGAFVSLIAATIIVENVGS